MAFENRLILPKNVTPINYKLHLTPDLTNFNFYGEVSIKVTIKNPSHEIVLNSAELEIENVSVVSGQNTVKISNFKLDENTETLAITTTDIFPAGEAIINIRYKGELNDRLLGFYRSSYLDKDGDQKFLAATQFESTDARRAFPCWDEPEAKSTFDVTLTVKQEFTAVSNMPVVSETINEDGTKSLDFDTTPKMSTYLLAFIVGDLACIQKKSKSGTLMRVWTTSGKENQGKFALETALDLLDFYNEYFGIPFPLPKLDHLAIPDFAAGAMENWGAITYREVALLVDPENSSAGTRQIVASIISHEMAHMWFGDLVTMKWWNDLWLNESFASWMGDKAVDAIHPEWEMWTQFLTADTASAFNLDGLSNSHPIEQEVNNPAEIGQLFDAISYSKGGSVLRMLENYLGEKDFQSGIRHYMNKHSYGNAETRDLWDSLAHASGKPVEQVMDSWVQQTGFPIINVSKKGGSLLVDQDRFLYENILDNQSVKDQTRWQIPLNVGFHGDTSPISVLFADETTKINLPSETGEWIKLNLDQTGFYRVNYEPSDILNFKNAIQKGTLPPRDRLGLQGDAFALCKAGYTSPKTFLNLAEAYSGETDASVLSDLANGLRNIENLIETYDFHKTFRDFCKGIFVNTYKSIGWDKKPNEGHLDSLLRSTALSNLGHYGDPEVIAEAKKRFDLYCSDTNLVHPDLRSLVFQLAANHGGQDTYEKMWELEKSTALQEEKVRLHGALASFEDEDLLKQTLERSLSNDIRVQDSIRVIVSVSSTQKGRALAWEFIRTNWNEIDRRYGDGGFALMRLVSLVSGFTTNERLEEVSQFFNDNPTPAAERTIKQAKERIQLNISWLTKYQAEIEDFLTNK